MRGGARLFDLPGLNGREILAQLRINEATRSIPVVIFSGSNAASDLAECYRCGANSWVVKPDDPTEYVDRLATIAHYWLAVNHGSDALTEA